MKNKIKCVIKVSGKDIISVMIFQFCCWVMLTNFTILTRILLYTHIINQPLFTPFTFTQLYPIQLHHLHIINHLISIEIIFFCPALSATPTDSCSLSPVMCLCSTSLHHSSVSFESGTCGFLRFYVSITWGDVRYVAQQVFQVFLSWIFELSPFWNHVMLCGKQLVRKTWLSFTVGASCWAKTRIFLV